MKSVSQSASSPGKGDSLSLDLKVGYNVKHELFGVGRITAIEGQGSDKKATIFFPGKGAKTLLLRFANLTIVEG
jgi:DNA helicase-2/ATP-dependent DNA helicase PcrA